MADKQYFYHIFYIPSKAFKLQDFLLGGAVGGRLVFNFKSSDQVGPMMAKSINNKVKFNKSFYSTKNFYFYLILLTWFTMYYKFAIQSVFFFCRFPIFLLRNYSKYAILKRKDQCFVIFSISFR